MSSEGKTRLTALDKIQPILLIGAIGFGLLLAWQLPTVATHIGWLVKVGVFFVIYLVMLGVQERSVLQAFGRLKPTAIALGINILFTPVFAWALGYVFLRDHPDIWVGLILYLVTPCIGWYLVFTELADGDIELGVSLLFWNIALQIFLMPFYLYLLAGQIIAIELDAIIESIALFLLFPYALAFVTRRLWRATNRGTDITDAPQLPFLKTALSGVACGSTSGALRESSRRRDLRRPGPDTVVLGVALLWLPEMYGMAPRNADRRVRP